jgi:site-specific DNA-methyltransferase (adenine-specific)
MHLSEGSVHLDVVKITTPISEAKPVSGAVEFIILPYFRNIDTVPEKKNLYAELNEFIYSTDNDATIAVLTSPVLAADFCAQLHDDAQLKLWIGIKLSTGIAREEYISEQHAALLILTKYKGSLKHAKTRIGYTYCPYCNKTTKDYGGKKHLYHKFGTIMSDVWRDITVDFDEYPLEIENRLADLFGIPEYTSLNVYDMRRFYKPLENARTFSALPVATENTYLDHSSLLNGDCMEQLKSIPDNSIDFCFADPPYNLQKKYEGWNDGIDIQEYFEWCDKWLTELARVLKPGRTLAVLNIPQWCIRHFKFLNTVLDFQDWIIWEGLSMPVRMIMPAHYSILCFSKGKPRPLPGIVRHTHSVLEQNAIQGLKEGYCVRPNCIDKRFRQDINDREFVSNVWSDIHRLKHNSRRVDHPCQLPPMFMYRLLSLFTNEEEFVLDPFNGAGTTTLTATQLNRKYIGIELSEYYHNITRQRHLELSNGGDPFRKITDDKPKAKNSPVARLKKQKYAVSKKGLQLEIRAITEQIGHIPTKDEVKNLSSYPMEYFENYFINWGEVTAAARTTGMSENRFNEDMIRSDSQLRLFK